jgi:hypothetical protein
MSTKRSSKLKERIQKKIRSELSGNEGEALNNALQLL